MRFTQKYCVAGMSLLSFMGGTVRWIGRGAKWQYTPQIRNRDGTLDILSGRR
ncbi:hypothetical protein M413DRAFT_163946 [Hebeloma cylindrosporum]|uniref:Uncharacterized protein n=1 Tax=Hebeloma cylindrosporum TaxID=76867 RepID=A0A0C3C8L1_HEBCY|nr:hypothetical protein M413DRAFT_163946 [Hebeloma cylindrosporum h7]